jgi:hypothetical protein
MLTLLMLKVDVCNCTSASEFKDMCDSASAARI